MSTIKDKETLVKQPTLSKIIIEIKLRNVINYLLKCLKPNKKKDGK